MRFIGQYVSDFETVQTASLVSGQNMIAISKPGYGKSEMALAGAQASAGADHVNFLELDPSTPPEVIRGAYDPAKLLNGELIRRLEGTPYDPAARVVILDELYRANDSVFDSLIHATSMKTRAPLDRPIFWGTSNFVNNNERTEALRDRFALWFWLEPGALDVKGIVGTYAHNGDSLEFGDHLPKWEDALKIRAAQPGPRAENAIADLLETLKNESESNGFEVNPRRLFQWYSLVFGYSVHVTGTTDFASVPGEASKILKYAYPTTDRSKASKWREVAASIVDAIGAAIDSYMGEALEKFREVSKLKSAAERSGKAVEMAMIIQNAQSDLKKIGGDDPRVEEASKTLTNWLTAAVRGEPIKL